MNLQLQTVYLILDDIIDKSEFRRRQLCWHKLETVGRLAVNDAILIENCLFYILKKYARHLERYAEILDLFHETTVISAIGETVDVKMIDVNKFSMQLHRTISIAKTSFYGFYLPIALATLSHG